MQPPCSRQPSWRVLTPRGCQAGRAMAWMPVGSAVPHPASPAARLQGIWLGSKKDLTVWQPGLTCVQILPLPLPSCVTSDAALSASASSSVEIKPP